jgi:Leucine-rich repeat (LRR) protein
MSNYQRQDQQPKHDVQGETILQRMKKSFFLLMFAMCATLQLAAQTAVSSDRPILNTTQLDQQPWFYNLDSALANPDKVYKLSLIDQKIKELPAEFGSLRNLQVLNLSNCKLKAIPHEIKECKNIQTMSLYGNKIRVLPPEMRELKQLEILYLGKNKLMELPAWLGTMTKIRRLDISRNALTPADVSNAKRMLPKADITD